LRQIDYQAIEPKAQNNWEILKLLMLKCACSHADSTVQYRTFPNPQKIHKNIKNNNLQTWYKN